MKSKTVSLTIIEKLDYLMWDYNISAQDSYEVLIGSKPMAGHYDQFSLFRKMLETFPWFTIMELLPLPRIKELLTEQVTTKLRSKQLQTRYEYIRDRLSATI
ncbi:MAG: hypothetical protein RBQ87_08060 [Candidatus Cloacimonadaceae bacterium]|jgi:hypothetical protein|nr:hypothetical protein [Candidatus Cloacimonadota bacterium]MDY0326115.1 hypothetical protein [Candidatus Cloacimonadaceae bacterium]